MSAFGPSLFDAVAAYARHYRDRRRLHSAERLLNAMPAHLRKDIGWPDSARIARGSDL